MAGEGLREGAGRGWPGCEQGEEPEGRGRGGAGEPARFGGERGRKAEGVGEGRGRGKAAREMGGEGSLKGEGQGTRWRRSW